MAQTAKAAGPYQDIEMARGRGPAGVSVNWRVRGWVEGVRLQAAHAMYLAHGALVLQSYLPPSARPWRRGSAHSDFLRRPDQHRPGNNRLHPWGRGRVWCMGPNNTPWRHGGRRTTKMRGPKWIQYGEGVEVITQFLEAHPI